MAIQHTITDEGSHVLIVSTGYQPSRHRLNKQTHDLRKMKDGQGVEFLRISSGPTTILDIYHANVLSPASANIAALEVAIGPYFFNSGDGFEVTIAELLVMQTNGTLPSGQWVFVSDICDRGGWLFCSSSTMVDESGFGLFLNAAWDSAGDTSGVLALTGVAPTATAVKWNPLYEAIVITASNFGATPFAVGATITDQSGWSGIVLDTDNATYVYAYSTAGYLPEVGDFLDGGGTMTADVDSAAKDNATGSIYTYIDPTDTDGTYLNYQLIDEELQDGTNPVTNAAAYQVLPKATAGMGYNLVTAAMAISLATGVVYRRVDDLGNHIQGTAGTANDNPCYRFPWGDTTFTNCKTAVSSQWEIHNSIGSTIDGVDLANGSVCEIAIESGANIDGLKIANYFSFTNKTLAAEAFIANMYITEDDTTSETLTYATWMFDGRRVAIVELTPTLLTTGFSTGGIQLLPALGSHKYPKFEMDYVNLGDGSEAFGAGNVFEIKSSTSVLARVTELLVKTAGPTEFSVLQVVPTQLQGPAARFQGIFPNTAIMLNTASNVDFTISNVANGSRVYVVIRYNIFESTAF